jgi:hypothetical protein
MELFGLSRTLAELHDAVRAQTPSVPLTGPVTADNTTWFTSFAQAEGKNVVLLSMHYYRANGQDPSSTIQTLISYPDTNLQKELVQLNAASQAAGVPFRMAESNSFYNGGAPNVSDSYASALWVIDHLFTIAQGGSIGVNLHGAGNGDSYTPIADNDGVVVDARPEYYGFFSAPLPDRALSLPPPSTPAPTLSRIRNRSSASSSTTKTILRTSSSPPHVPAPFNPRRFNSSLGRRSPPLPALLYKGAPLIPTVPSPRNLLMASLSLRTPSPGMSPLPARLSSLLLSPSTTPRKFLVISGPMVGTLGAEKIQDSHFWATCRCRKKSGSPLGFGQFVVDGIKSDLFLKFRYSLEMPSLISSDPKLDSPTP